MRNFEERNGGRQRLRGVLRCAITIWRYKRQWIWKICGRRGVERFCAISGQSVRIDGVGLGLRRLFQSNFAIRSRRLRRGSSLQARLWGVGYGTGLTGRIAGLRGLLSNS